MSTEFFNSIMWYATKTNVTKYRGGAKVLDSVINGTVSYSPPEMRVKQDNLMSVHISKGLIHATCLPDQKHKPPTNVSTLFKAEFSNLAGKNVALLPFPRFLF